ncbi:unnamed protein product [Trifolium pratense]|uniref:Uncharacterized protein n=1 Tax=Trifolium pratense TaxID=57577 RepID=A0ACB0KER8_TRIPR|nr:unnamed protein product [Trifolium pratense]
MFITSKGEKMTQILMFSYALIVFLSLFLLVIGTSTNTSDGPIKTGLVCITDKDCPIKTYYISRCIENLCEFH